MIEIEDVTGLVDPVAVCAFEGWNDAGDAATDVVGHLVDTWEARPIGAVDPEDYYDYQVNRPLLWVDEQGMRQLRWPGMQIFLARPPGSHRDIVLVRGIEPSMRWRQFVAELLAALDDLGVRLVVTVGAMLAEVPHTRPIPVTGTATEPDLEDRLRLASSTYQGPTGIVGVLADACTRLDIPAVSLWASVPHYLPHPPNPKATLALLTHLEDLLEVSVDLGDLPEDAQAWDRGVAELVEADEDIRSFAEALESEQDTASLPEASGDAIAAEFERFLKRRERDS